jgi:hypothetical protein
MLHPTKKIPSSQLARAAVILVSREEIRQTQVSILLGVHIQVFLRSPLQSTPIISKTKELHRPTIPSPTVTLPDTLTWTNIPHTNVTIRRLNHKEIAKEGAEEPHCIDILEYCRHKFASPSASTAFRSQSTVRKENCHFTFGQLKTVNLVVTTNIHVPLPLEVLGSNCTPKRRSLLFRSLMSPHKRCQKIRRSKGDYRCRSIYLPTSTIAIDYRLWLLGLLERLLNTWRESLGHHVMIWILRLQKFCQSTSTWRTWLKMMSFGIWCQGIT